MSSIRTFRALVPGLEVRALMALLVPLAVGCGAPHTTPDAAVPRDDDSGAAPDDAGPAGDAGTSTDAGTSADADARVPPTALDLEVLASRIADVVCAETVGCEGDAISDARCANAQTSARDTAGAAIAAAVAAGRAHTDAGGLEACVEALASLDWCEWKPRDTAAHWMGACRELIVGHVEDGDACGFDWECGPDSECATRLSCGGSCAPRPSSGSCRDAWQCAEGFVCHSNRCWPEAEVPEPTTVVRHEGESCDLRVDGAREVCEDGLTCAYDLASGAGRCRGPLVGDEPCRRSVPDLCGEDGFCDAPHDGVGECRGLPLEGETCRGVGSGVRCATGLGCGSDAICVPRQPIGGVCHQNDVCWSNECDLDTQTCVAPSCVRG